MQRLPVERLSAGLQTATASLASLVRSSDQGLRIPACPDWTLRQLATHTGRAHRWAAAIVATRSAEFIEFRTVPDGKAPDGAAGQASWLTAGAALLIDAVRAAGDDQVWTFGGLGPAGFWARRMAHETIVHCGDAQHAAGDPTGDIPADLAADAIDEWLTVMSPLNSGQNDLASILPQGTALQVLATDAGAGWLVTHSPDGVDVRAEPGAADVTLTGHAADVLLVLMRRLPAARVQVAGDAALLERWLALTAF